jgi:hypothetical protein
VHTYLQSLSLESQLPKPTKSPGLAPFACTALELAPHAPSSLDRGEPPLLDHLELEDGKFAPFEYQYLPDLVYRHAPFNACTV